MHTQRSSLEVAQRILVEQSLRLAIAEFNVKAEAIGMTYLDDCTNQLKELRAKAHKRASDSAVAVDKVGITSMYTYSTCTCHQKHTYTNTSTECVGS